jgi:hypothetical protein
MEGVECAAAECAGGVAEDSAAEEADMEGDSSCLGASVVAGACAASFIFSLLSLSLSLALSLSLSLCRALSLSVSLSRTFWVCGQSFFLVGGAQQSPYRTGEIERKAPCGKGERDCVERCMKPPNAKLT